MMLTVLLLALLSAAHAADWNTLMAEAAKLQTQGAFADAETKFQEALAQAELFGSNDRRLATTLNNLGTLYRGRGNYPLAERHYNRALAIWTEINGPVTTVLNNLAVLFVDQGRYAEAEANYRKALSIEERAHSPSDAVIAPMLTNLAS